MATKIIQQQSSKWFFLCFAKRSLSFNLGFFFEWKEGKHTNQWFFSSFSLHSHTFCSHSSYSVFSSFVHVYVINWILTVLAHIIAGYLRFVGKKSLNRSTCFTILTPNFPKLYVIQAPNICERSSRKLVLVGKEKFRWKTTDHHFRYSMHCSR